MCLQTATVGYAETLQMQTTLIWAEHYKLNFVEQNNESWYKVPKHHNSVDIIWRFRFNV